ncbi:MAG: universal stress protein [Desulfovermiculus sp.]
MAYGQRLTLALPAQQMDQKKVCFQESMHLGHNLGLEFIVVSEYTDTDLEGLESEIMKVHKHRLDARVESGLPELCTRQSVGLVILPGVEASWLDFFRSPRYMKLAHRLSCPVLMARGTYPYTAILVPFNGSPESELALETGCDMAKQLGAKVTVMFVQEPDFLHHDQKQEQGSRQDVMDQARQMTHIHKVSMQEIAVTGNVVREVVSRSAQFNLLVLGSKSPDREWLRPHVGELLMRRSKCSVLLTVLGHIAVPADTRENGHGV